MFSELNSEGVQLTPDIETDADRKTLYIKLEEYSRLYHLGFDSKKTLNTLYTQLIIDLNEHMDLDGSILNPLPISAKWPTIIFRSLGLLSTLIGVASLAFPLCFAVAISSVIVAVYAVCKSLEDISKEERRLKIQAALLAGKEYVFQGEIFNKNVLLSKQEHQKLKSPQQSIGGTLRNAVGVAGSILGLYGCFIGLLGASLMIASPITLGIGLSIATLATITFCVFTHKYKYESKRAIKRLSLWAHGQEKREREYLVRGQASVHW